MDKIRNSVLYQKSLKTIVSYLEGLEAGGRTSFFGTVQHFLCFPRTDVLVTFQHFVLFSCKKECRASMDIATVGVSKMAL